MSLPADLERRLRLPVIAAPMFLGSGPDLVTEVCKAGMIGTFPALNARTSEGYESWLAEIAGRLSAQPDAAPFGVNLIVHKSNQRLDADLEITVRNRVPVVITSLGAARHVVDAVHAYGGLVLHDVINLRHARKAAEAGVDGIVAVSAGAGGHGGTLSPFALVSEIREFFGGLIVLSGAISRGGDVLAARAMGADLAYIGTRFLATIESLASEEQKQMMVASSAADILYTPSISGVNANFMRRSLTRVGLDPDNLPAHGQLDMSNEARAWKTVWSAGQGVGAIKAIVSAAELCAQLVTEYSEALGRVGSDSFAHVRPAAHQQAESAAS
jgi:nitronate monooxygenase